nr:hypothetical protein CFP56_28710 [Quercus suber]
MRRYSPQASLDQAWSSFLLPATKASKTAATWKWSFSWPKAKSWLKLARRILGRINLQSARVVAGLSPEVSLDFPLNVLPSHPGIDSRLFACFGQASCRKAVTHRFCIEQEVWPKFLLPAVQGVSVALPKRLPGYIAALYKRYKCTPCSEAMAGADDSRLLCSYDVACQHIPVSCCETERFMTDMYRATALASTSAVERCVASRRPQLINNDISTNDLTLHQFTQYAYLAGFKANDLSLS